MAILRNTGKAFYNREWRTPCILLSSPRVISGVFIQGTWNSAAPSYTEVKLAEISAELFRDIDKDTVDFYGQLRRYTKEPALPTVFPNNPG